MSKTSGKNGLFGLGDDKAKLRLFIGNQPIFPVKEPFDGIHPLANGELNHYVEVNSNHWRKIFNVYAKLCHLLFNSRTSWQEYRDHHLLQAKQNHALVFSPWQPNTESIDLICGKTYAQASGLFDVCDEISEGFFQSTKQGILVTPYFDYRAMSNKKIEQLANILEPLLKN